MGGGVLRADFKWDVRVQFEHVDLRCLHTQRERENLESSLEEIWAGPNNFLNLD